MLKLERPRGNVEVVASRRRASRSYGVEQFGARRAGLDIPRYPTPSPVGRVRINLHERSCSHR